MTDFTYKRIQPENITDVKRVLELAFNTEFSTEYLIKKFDTSAIGISHIGYIAYDGNIPAATYSVFPTLMQLNGKKIMGAQSGDTATNPAYQGKGLFVTLAVKTYELCKEQGIELVFGFPNDNSFPGFKKKLNWQFMNNFHNYRFIVPTLPLSLLNKRSESKAMSKFPGIQILSKKDVDAFPGASLQVNGIAIDKSSTYINYKSYTENTIIAVDGVKVWVKISKSMQIGDIEKTDLVTFRKILRKLKQYAFFHGIPVISFSVNENNYWDTLLSKTYPFTKGSPIGYLPINNLLVEQLNFTTVDIDYF